MSSLFFFSRTLDWGGGNGFGSVGRCRDEGTIFSEVSMLKSPDFKINAGELQQPGFDP